MAQELRTTEEQKERLRQAYRDSQGGRVVSQEAAHQMIDVRKIWLTPTDVWIQTSDGRKACEHFADYKGLRNATVQERENYTLSPYGIHWEQLDEDLCYEGFFAGK